MLRYPRNRPLKAFGFFLIALEHLIMCSNFVSSPRVKLFFAERYNNLKTKLGIKCFNTPTSERAAGFNMQTPTY